MAVPVIEASQWTENTSTGTSLTLTAPSGISAGELLVLIVGHDALSWPTMTGPTGWAHAITMGNSTTDSGAAIFYKIADGSEGNVSVSSSISTYYGGLYLRVSGAAGYVGGFETWNGASASTITVPSVTTPCDDCLAFYLVTGDGADTSPFSQPTGWTEYTDQAVSTGLTGFGIAIGTKSMATAGATGNGTVSSSAIDGCLGAQFYIPPATAEPILVAVNHGTDLTANTVLNCGYDGEDRLIVVGFSEEALTDPVTAVTVDGKSCTELSVSPAINTEGLGNVTSLWYIQESTLGTSRGRVTVAASGDTAGQGYVIAEFLNVGALIDSGKDQTSTTSPWTVTGIDTPANGLVIAFGSHGNGSVNYTSWTPLTQVFSESIDTAAATHGFAWGVETSAQTNQSYSASALTANTRGTLIVATFRSSAIIREQEGFRWRYDNGSEATATWIENQDVDTEIGKNTNIRLRVLSNYTNNPPSEALTLQYRKVGAAGVWANVPLVSGQQNVQKLGGASAANAATLSHSIGAGSNRCLIVFVGSEITGTMTIPTVTYGGQSMTRITGVQCGTSTYGRIDAYFLNDAGIENATSTTIATSNVPQTGGIIAQAYQNCVQTTPSVTDTDFSNTSVNPLTGVSISSIAGSAVVGGSLQGNNGSTASWGGTNPLTQITVNGGSDNHLDLIVTPESATMAIADRISTGTETVAVQNTWSTTVNRSVAMAFRIDGVTLTSEIVMAASNNIAAGGANVSARLTAPSGKSSTANFGGGRIQDDENPTDAVDIDSGDYREDEWCIKITDNAGSSDSFDFRVVTSDGVLFDTYTVTPTLDVLSVILKTVNDTLTASFTNENTTNSLTSARSDTFSVSLNEAVVNALTSARSDTLSVAVNEITTILTTLARNDALELTLDELTQIFVTAAVSDTLSVSLTEAQELFQGILVNVADTLNVSISESSPVFKFLFTVIDYLQVDFPDKDYTWEEVEALRENDNINALFKFLYQADDLTIGDFETFATSSFGWDEVTAVAGNAITQITASDTLTATITEAIDLLNMFTRLDDLDATITDEVALALTSSRSDTLSVAIAESTLNVLRSARTDDLDVQVIGATAILVTLAQADLLDVSVDEITSILTTLARNDTLNTTLTELVTMQKFIARTDDLDISFIEAINILVRSSQSDDLDISFTEAVALLNRFATSDTLSVAFDEVAKLLWATLEAYRWRDDDGTESTASWLAGENTTISRAKALNTRLRVLLDTSSDTDALQLVLQYRRVGDPDWEWRNVE